MAPVRRTADGSTGTPESAGASGSTTAAAADARVATHDPASWSGAWSATEASSGSPLADSPASPAAAFGGWSGSAEAARFASPRSGAAFGLQRSPATGAPAARTAAPILARPHATASAPAASSPLPLPFPAASQGIVAGPSPAPTVQALAQPAPVLAPTATALVQRVDGAAPAPPSESDGQSESELDELAKKLFRRFQNRLRAELIYEREAKGLTFDN
jgi:hypothetical protein